MLKFLIGKIHRTYSSLDQPNRRGALLVLLEQWRTELSASGTWSLKSTAVFIGASRRPVDELLDVPLLDLESGVWFALELDLRCVILVGRLEGISSSEEEDELNFLICFRTFLGWVTDLLELREFNSLTKDTKSLTCAVIGFLIFPVNFLIWKLTGETFFVISKGPTFWVKIPGFSSLVNFWGLCLLQ